MSKLSTQRSSSTATQRESKGKKWYVCGFCQVFFLSKVCYEKRGGNKFCSKSCYGNTLVGKPSNMLGKSHTAETKRKQSLWRPNERQRVLMGQASKKPPVTFSCPICNSKKEMQPGRAKRTSYCSYACLGLSKKREILHCVDCGKMKNRYRLQAFLEYEKR